jgi:hypothetical protein
MPSQHGQAQISPTQSAKQTVRPDPYADRCCITVRAFHCANNLRKNVATPALGRPEEGAYRSVRLSEFRSASGAGVFLAAGGHDPKSAVRQWALQRTGLVPRRPQPGVMLFGFRG